MSFAQSKTAESEAKSQIYKLNSHFFEQKNSGIKHELDNEIEKKCGV